MSSRLNCENQYRKYDYLNKYTQLEILEQNYEREIGQRNPATAHEFVSTFDSPEKAFVNVAELAPAVCPNNSSQISQYRLIVSKLQMQISNLRQENSILRENLRCDRMFCEQNQHYLEQEIHSLRYRYQVLNEELAQMNRSTQAPPLDFIANLVEILNVQEGLQGSGELNKGYFEILQGVLRLKQRNQICEDFLSSLKQMYCTIQGKEAPKELKALWKWMKGLGKLYSSFQQIKRNPAGGFPIERQIPSDLQENLIQKDFTSLLKQMCFAGDH